MLTVHHLEHSQSFRVVWLLEELGESLVPYDLKIYKRDSETLLAPKDFKDISPLGTSPTITVGNFALSESNAIIDFCLDLAEKAQTNASTTTPVLRPAAGSEERADYLFWFHTSAGSFQPLMSTDSLFRIIMAKLPCPISSIFKMVARKVHQNYIDPRLESILKLAEQQLTAHPYLAGESLTAADVTSVYSFDAAFGRYPDSLPQKYPHCQAWLERISKRDAYQQALKKIGQTSISFSA